MHPVTRSGSASKSNRLVLCYHYTKFGSNPSIIQIHIQISPKSYFKMFLISGLPVYMPGSGSAQKSNQLILGLLAQRSIISQFQIWFISSVNNFLRHQYHGDRQTHTDRQTAGITLLHNFTSRVTKNIRILK